MDVELGGRHIAFELTRSARARRARLEIQLHRGVRVILPDRAPASDAEKLLRSKSRWLLRNLARFERLRKIVPNRQFVSGERLPYLGEELTLEVTRGPARVERRESALIVSTPHQRSVRRALEDWYVEQAHREIALRVAEAAQRHGVAIRGIGVLRGRSRWGSCSPRGRISINWRLMLASPAILDYLIAHELSHIGHPNHSPQFWARVAELHPGCDEAERWLRRFGQSLVL
jgi:predicted metal-dependent hydrolase